MIPGPHVELERPTRMTLAEYLRFEETSEGRHEYVDGLVNPVSGGTLAYIRVKGHLGVELDRHLRGGPCEVLGGDFRLTVPGRNQYRYPDASVFQGPVETAPEEAQAYSGLNPVAAFEVLQAKSEADDRGPKLRFYERIASLCLVVHAHSERPEVEWFERSGSGTWERERVEGLDATADWPSIGVQLPLRDLYRDMAFG